MIFENLTLLYNELNVHRGYSICVFDLDSTLFNVSPRSEKILHEFAHEHNFSNLLKISIDFKDWGVYEALLRAGYTQDEHHELHLKLKKYWSEKFFSSEYLHYDTPYLGAIHFVQSLHKNKIPIHYLTGRDSFRMSLGTQAVLKKWGFPAQKEQIHLKPHKDIDDHLFKWEWLKTLSEKHPMSTIYLFENEPVNINLIGQKLPSVRLIYMNTTHSRQEEVRVPHTEIFNYTIER